MEANKLDSRIYIGTISFRLSERSFPDFIRSGMNVNQLPMLSDAVSRIQSSLDAIEPRRFHHRGSERSYGSGSYGRGPYGSVAPFNFEIASFTVGSVSFESGSVYAKMTVVATVVFGLYEMVAAYPDFKIGLKEIRDDIIRIANASFGVNGSGPINGNVPNDNGELRYYFVQPRRLEDEILKRRPIQK